MKGEEEVESLVGDPENHSEIGGADQLISYNIHFANAVELYQKKNWNCFRCSSPDHLLKDCPKDLSKVTRKESLNMEKGMTKKGGQALQKPVVTQLASWNKAPRAKDAPENSLLEP